MCEAQNSVAIGSVHLLHKKREYYNTEKKIVTR